MENGHAVWRYALRGILRNTNAGTIRDWCRAAGINGSSTKTLVGYAEGATVAELAQALGCEVRALSALRLRALKQLRCFLVSYPMACPRFIRILTENAPPDDGPQPVKAQ